MLAAYLSGAGLGASLIIAIGAQNAFVLRQGIRAEFAKTVAGICVAVDWSLIALGAVGFGTVVERYPSFTAAAAWGGAAYLAVHGALAFRSALHPGRLTAENTDGETARKARTLGGAVAATLAVSLLNPHVYLDTVVLLGSVASQYERAGRLAFVLGAGTASSVWFFGLALGGRAMAPLFASERAWRVLDVLIGCVMWGIAASLVVAQVRG